VNFPEPIAAICQWAQQTAVLVLRSPQVCRDPKSGVPLEVHEQTKIRADAAMDKLFQEAVVECGVTPAFIPVFSAKVLDWVASNWPPRGGSSPLA
jgi:hypothetical protein